MRWISVQSNRMELYTLAALLLALLTFSHLVWGWPHGVFDAAVQNGGGVLTADFIWKAIFCLSVLTVALLFYKGSQTKHRDGKGGSPCGKKPPQRSQLSLYQYSLLVGSFESLTWAQKAAMKVMCKRCLNHEMNLRLELEKMGFGSGQELMERIVKPVCASRLVDYGKDGEIAPKQAALNDVEEIVNGWNYQL